jgi:CheY-like chemotaxis protein
MLDWRALSMSLLATILLVEDNADDIELMRHAFKRAQIVNPLNVIDDGEKAIAYLAGEAPYQDRMVFPLPSLVLLDLKLPRRSGFEVLEYLRKNELTKHTPVVVLTSSNQNADIERAYSLCANSYLVKPVSRDALLEMVKSLNYYWIKLNQTVRAS